MNKNKRVRVTENRVTPASTNSSSSTSQSHILRIAAYMKRTEEMHTSWLEAYKDASFAGALAGKKIEIAD